MIERFTYYTCADDDVWEVFVTDNQTGHQHSARANEHGNRQIAAWVRQQIELFPTPPKQEIEPCQSTH